MNLRHEGSCKDGESAIKYCNQQYKGNGPTRSCGKCGKHHSISRPGWKRHVILGMICVNCAGEK